LKNKTTCAGLIAALVLGASILTPVAAWAQPSQAEASHHRQKTKNQWRNLAIGGGAATLYGLLKHDNTVTFAGAAGTLYSLNRYEQDRKSQSKIDRARAVAFHRSSFKRNGQHYVRKTVTRNGKKYYQFVHD